jgi:hypothetical protein
MICFPVVRSGLGCYDTSIPVLNQSVYCRRKRVRIYRYIGNLPVMGPLTTHCHWAMDDLNVLSFEQRY